jgi:hypothetical protein
MFQFPGSARLSTLLDITLERFPHSEIHGSKLIWQLPVAYRSQMTSFIASLSQGILRTPLLRSSSFRSFRHRNQSYPSLWCRASRACCLSCLMKDIYFVLVLVDFLAEIHEPKFIQSPPQGSCGEVKLPPPIFSYRQCSLQLIHELILNTYTLLYI